MKTTYNVVRGYAEIEGVLYREGSSFDADPVSVKAEIRKGIIVVAETKKKASREL
ncbi:hypothetical protein [Paenibacillus crassostreae]|uniref:hypothetical protein n=1 Tax=Paenibacillus crassostreae TaxID=1763538 RepID=UPI000AB30E6A|nr:hypothetical protein [Paenibacillus crassostreae]